MPKELALREMEEVVGAFKGIFSNRLFTEVTIGDYVISMENGRESTSAVAGQLNKIGKGTKIGIIRIGGAFRLRRCKDE